MSIAILIPSYQRSGRIRQVVQNIAANTCHPYDVFVIVEDEDFKKYEEALDCTGANVIFNQRSRNYAGAINTAVTKADVRRHGAVFVAADDLYFHPGWDSDVLGVLSDLSTIKVVGTNDLLNKYVVQGVHATHYLVSSDYIQNPGGIVDGQRGHLLFEGYDHNYTDTEFIATAKMRAVFAPCLTSIVEHLHWTAGKSEVDATSRKAYAAIDNDSKLYTSRQHLWMGISK